MALKTTIVDADWRLKTRTLAPNSQNVWNTIVRFVPNIDATKANELIGDMATDTDIASPVVDGVAHSGTYFGVSFAVEGQDDRSVTIIQSLTLYPERVFYKSYATLGGTAYTWRMEDYTAAGAATVLNSSNAESADSCKLTSATSNSVSGEVQPNGRVNVTVSKHPKTSSASYFDGHSSVSKYKMWWHNKEINVTDTRTYTSTPSDVGSFTGATISLPGTGVYHVTGPLYLVRNVTTTDLP